MNLFMFYLIWFVNDYLIVCCGLIMDNLVFILYSLIIVVLSPLLLFSKGAEKIISGFCRCRIGSGGLAFVGAVESALSFYDRIVDSVSSYKSGGGDNSSGSESNDDKNNNNNNNNTKDKKDGNDYNKTNDSNVIKNSYNKLLYLIEYIKNKIINIIFDNKFFNNQNSKYCYIIPFIFSNLGKEIPVDAGPLITFSFNILILSLIILVCFINLIGYFISIYLINKYDVEKKFPKYFKLIRYYEGSTLFFIVVEILICLLSLLAIILLCFFILSIYIIKLW
jgi:hypothetical protein